MIQNSCSLPVAGPVWKIHSRGFTLIELLMVVAIVAVLALIAVPNFLLARHRAMTARCTSNLKAISIALNTYKIDLNKYPLADGVAGLEESMGQTAIANGPAANGSWDGVPRVLVRLGYLLSDQYLFCPEYAEKFRGPRMQRFRYAYNHSALDTGGTGGGANDIERQSGDLWIARCLWVPVDHSFSPGAKDVTYPHGEANDRENVLYANSRVELRDGAADYAKAY